MRKTVWFKSLAVGLVTAFIVAGTATFLDWRLNPGGLFHDELGTHWSVVAETAASWFFPVAALVSIVAALVIFALARSGK